MEMRYKFGNAPTSMPTKFGVFLTVLLVQLDISERYIDSSWRTLDWELWFYGQYWLMLAFINWNTHEFESHVYWIADCRCCIVLTSCYLSIQSIARDCVAWVSWQSFSCELFCIVLRNNIRTQYSTPSWRTNPDTLFTSSSYRPLSLTP